MDCNPNIFYVKAEASLKIVHCIFAFYQYMTFGGIMFVSFQHCASPKSIRIFMHIKNITYSFHNSFTKYSFVLKLLYNLLKISQKKLPLLIKKSKTCLYKMVLFLLFFVLINSFYELRRKVFA